MDELNAIAATASSDIFTDGMIIMMKTFAVNIIFSWFIIHFLYYRKSHRRDFYFTFLLISIAIFFLMFFMTYMLDSMKAKTSIGIGIGLFGIFSIMRYRTDTMPVREMTYLFIIIALAVVNALASTMPLIELVLTNIIVIIAIIVCEWRLKTENVKLVQYDKIELIAPEKRDELIADLKKRTGLDITKVEVGAIDFLRDMTMLRVHYRSTDSGSNSVDKTTKLTRQDLQ